jgi:transcription termination factor Rho
MAVLDRETLGASPLADLHVIAGELGLDGFRRLRKADLVDAIIERSGGDPAPADADSAPEDTPDTAPDDAEEERPARRRRSRGGRGRSRAVDNGEDPKSDEEDATDEDATDVEAPAAEPASRRRGRDRPAEREERSEAEGSVEGTVEVLGNGSAFVRTASPETSDDDVYISPAQVRRCELVSGDTVSGPVRPPRRSERHPSLVRVETINGRSADEVAGGDGTPSWDDLPAEFPSERFALGGGPGGPDEPTLKAIEWLTPFGRGSRVVIAGAARAGKTEALRRLAGALAAHDGLEVSVVLAGVRPEEISEWRAGPVEPQVAVSFAASPDAQIQAIERVVERARRTAARGGHAVVLVDTLAHVPPGAARKLLATARNITGGGSLTIVATAPEPVGGETTVIALDVALASTQVFPAIDLPRSGSLRPERLVGADGATAIATARSEAASV